MATTFAQLVAAARIHLQETLALITPVTPLVSQQGTPGAATVSYVLVAINSLGHSAGSQVATTATANATLNGTNFNRINWTKVARATGYKLYRSVGGASQGLIATLGDVATADDTGLAGDATTAPTDNTSGTVGIFWSDDELLDLGYRGARDMWRAFIDLHQDHFATDDITNMSLAASGTSISGVPSDVFRILIIEPRDTSESGTMRNLLFVPRRYNSREFINARMRSALDPTSGGRIYFTLFDGGSPVVAPTIKTAPAVTTVLLLRVVYVRGLGTLTSASSNPIPGESDHGLIAWIVSHALAKDREDKSPDPDWLAIYATEKKSCLVACEPRQEQEARIVEGVFDSLYDYDD